jgi:hypothetical protein
MSATEKQELLAELIRSRNGHRGAATRLINEARKLLDLPRALTEDETCILETSGNRLRKKLEELETINKKAATLTDDLDDELAACEASVADTEMTLTRIKRRLAAKGSAPAKSSPTLDDDDEPLMSGVATRAAPATASVKLPPLQLATFNGDYTEWTPFYDQFRSTIDSSDRFSGAQKLSYLKSALSGEAAKVIGAMKITDANYPLALDALIKRYNNERTIVWAHIGAIFNFPALKTGEPKGLRQLQALITEHLHGLRNHGIDPDHPFVIYCIVEKLDPATREQFEWMTTLSDSSSGSFSGSGTFSSTNKMLALDELEGFIDFRCRSLESAPRATVVSSKPSHEKADRGSHDSRRGKDGRSYNSTRGATKCNFCDGAGHFTNKCEAFRQLTVDKRREAVKAKKLCFNCLSRDHISANCTSKHTCIMCNGRHHSLLHVEPAPKAFCATDNGSGATCGHGKKQAPHPADIVLATALIPIKGHGNRGTVMCRALLDSGSQMSLITSSYAARLGLKRRRSGIQISGIGDVATSSSSEVSLVIEAPDDQRIQTVAFVMDRVTADHPVTAISKRDMELVHKLPLADPGFDKPGPIDLLLGMDVYEQIVLSEKRRDVNNLFLRETVFGWVVAGTATPSGKRAAANVAISASASTDALLRQFWEIESIPEPSTLTDEEQRCQHHFRRTTTRDATGRFQVSLPFKESPPNLGDSLQRATVRFKQLERRLARDPELRDAYAGVIQEFISMGHMEEVPACELDRPSNRVFHLCHHAVFKESTTTAIRVVFDGSMATLSGQSLNDTLMLGPRNQGDLTDHIFRFRFHQVALSADVAKMYRQVSLDDEAKDYHRLLWRDSPDEAIRHMRMTRVTYGVRSAGYHATSALQASVDGDDVDPRVATVVRRDFYMDDLMTGAESFQAAVALQDGLITALSGGGFPLRKWASSDTKLITRLPPDLRETRDSLDFFEEDYSIKALGINWFPTGDVFRFKVNFTPTDEPTKRQLLSDISKLFDPMGWLAPLIVRVKVLMQQTWTKGLAWEQTLPDDMLQTWRDISRQLPDLQTLEIPRSISTGPKKRIELHVFADASELAYAACVYSRVTHKDGSVTARLLLSKTRVAPVKTISLPRLELCAAHMAAKLVTMAREALEGTDFHISCCTAWSDSTIALAWIAAEPRRWKSFVANRVTAIQDVIPPERWRHVGTKDNPADHATRGLDVQELCELRLWWRGPAWLERDEQHWPTRTATTQAEVPEERPLRSCAAQTTETLIDPARFSNWNRLTRSLAYALRFIRNCRLKGRQRADLFEDVAPAHATRAKRAAPTLASIRHVLHLDPAEVSAAETCVLVALQATWFSEDVRALKDGKQLAATSRLRSLAPYISPDTGLLLVGGRLKRADVCDEAKHPILVDNQDHVATLIIRAAHKETLHAGPQATLAHLQQRIWIIGARSRVRKVVRNCTTCTRFTRDRPIQMMSDLPAERVTPSRPFTHTGLDFGGPFVVKTGLRSTGKAYLALFVCFSTKAVHLEAVSALTKEACIAALRRFVARRGRPAVLYSDNGTNFIGARNELAGFQEILRQRGQDSISGQASADGMTWSTIPPRAPHFGGLWEAGIKSAKHHLRRVMGLVSFSFEELQTVFCQIEAVLNSRPLHALSSDPGDTDVLTPGHFLTGSPLRALPDRRDDKGGTTLPHRWALLQQVTRDFWARWRSDYLSGLQQRKKWQREGTPICPDDLVLIAEPGTNPLDWPRARVTDVITGADGQTRVAKLRTATGEFSRPVHKLVVLPNGQNDGQDKDKGLADRAQKDVTDSDGARTPDLLVPSPARILYATEPHSSLLPTQQ